MEHAKNQSEELIELGVASTDTKGDPIGLVSDDKTGLRNPVAGGLSDD
jgi:hypothetical protein